MKHLICMASIFLLCHSSQAAVWHVNNSNPKGTAFTSIQQAIQSNSVVDGDTVRIEAGSKAYASFTLNKKLVLLADESDNQNMPIVQHAIFNSNAQGSTCIGLYFKKITYNVACQTIRLFQCQIEGMFSVNCPMFKTPKANKELNAEQKQIAKLTVREKEWLASKDSNSVSVNSDK
jgi:hypothetical protein